MGCYSSRKFVESSISDFWNQNPIVDYTVKQYIDLFEKLTAYKKDLRSTDGFSDNVLSKLFLNERNNHQNEFLKKNYLDINSKFGFCIPIILMFLMQYKDYKELDENYSKLFFIIAGRIENPRKIRNNLRGLKDVLVAYVTLISLNSFITVVQKIDEKEEEAIKEFYKIYSEEAINNNLSNLFNFEFQKDENIKTEEEQGDGKNIEIGIKTPEEITHFFKNNLKNLNPDLIRERLHDIFDDQMKNDEKNGRPSSNEKKKNNNNSREETPKPLERQKSTGRKSVKNIGRKSIVSPQKKIE